jgi:MFS family permease
VPYIILELPSQIGLRRFGASVWLSSAVTLWGIVLVAMAFVKTWQQLAALRALIGVFEAALFPGCAYLISCW